jgi:sugar lactone lactonase YvrE
MPTPTTQAELLLDMQAALGEGAIWNPLTARLNLVDISGKKVHEYDPGTRALRSWSTLEKVSTVVPRRSGGLVVALAGSIAALNTANGEVTFLAKPAEHDPAQCRFNDGKCDPQGRLWAGTMSVTEKKGQGALYCFAPGASPRRVLTDIGISNGLVWSLDGTQFYYIDSLTAKIDAFDFDPASGNLTHRRTAFAVPDGQGLPDGSTLDAEGMLWICHWDGWRVSRWDPVRGVCLAVIKVDAPQVTSCAFGGPDLKTLYITSAREGMTAEQLAKAPASGGLFVCHPGVAGIPAGVYAG